MNHVLIVSDNIALVSHIQALVASNTSLYQGINFDYCYSAINKNTAALSALGLTSINVKSETVVKQIVERYSLVISAHCKQIFPPNLVNKVRCINVHPGLNPHNRGWFPQVFSIINKKPIGCTIHEMNEKIDHGNIIYQKEVDIYPDDNSLTVYNRVQDAEKELLDNHLYNIVHGTYVSTPMLVEGNYNGIDDFKKLCELELDSVGSMREHIDLLRALSHGNFENAYFFDESGNKIFVKLELKARP